MPGADIRTHLRTVTLESLATLKLTWKMSIRCPSHAGTTNRSNHGVPGDLTLEGDQLPRLADA